MSGPAGGYSEDQLWDLLAQAYEMPYGTAQIALVEQVIGHADAAQLPNLAFAARMQGTTSYVYGGEPARAVVTFSWCLAEFDADPARYQRHQRNLLWHFKYMVNALTRFPEVPLERTYGVLDDMERRWRDTGHTLHAVYAQRHRVARHVGDFAAAEDYYTKWCTTPRDDLSDCAGCDPSSQAWWLSTRGRDEEAVALAEPVLAGVLTCSEQPQGILTTLLLPYLRTGRFDQARDAHRRAYRLHRPNLADLGDFADHLEFCARTGNEARGGEILERHLGWLDRAPSPYSAMVFAAAGALVLRRAADSDPDLTVHRPAHGDRPAATMPAAQLGADLREQSLALAERFDARNRTTRIGELVRSTLDAEPLVDYLPLSPTAPRTLSTVVSAPAAAAARPEVAVTAGPDELLDIIEGLHRDDEDAGPALDTFDQRYPVDGLTVRQRARRGAAVGVQLADAGDLAAAEVTWRAAAADYAASGDVEGEQKSLARIGLVLCETGRPDEGVQLAADATEVLLRSPSAQTRCDAVVRLAMSLSEAGRHDEAVAALDRAKAHLPEASARTQAAFAVRAMMVRLRAHQVEDIRALGDDVVAKARATGDRKVLGGAHAAYGAGLELAGDLFGAAEQITEALAGLDDPQVRRGLRFVRGNLLARTNRAGEAIDDLTETVADRTAAGDHRAAADARHSLATAYLNLNRVLDAAEVAEEELAYRLKLDAAAGDAPSCAVAVRHLLATIYQRLKLPDEAIAQLDAIGLDCARVGNQAGVGQMARESADILDRLDRDEAAANRYLAAAEAYRALHRPLDELYNRRRYARSVFWAHGAERALPAFEAVQEFADGLPQTLGRPLIWERATLDYDAARMLWGAEQLAEAARRAGVAADRYRELDRPGAASDADVLRSEILLFDGQPEPAEAAARQALAELPPDGNPRRAIVALAAALDAQDRPDEAAAARAQLT